MFRFVGSELPPVVSVVPLALGPFCPVLLPHDEVPAAELPIDGELFGIEEPLPVVAFEEEPGALLPLSRVGGWIAAGLLLTPPLGAVLLHELEPETLLFEFVLMLVFPLRFELLAGGC